MRFCSALFASDLSRTWGWVLLFAAPIPGPAIAQAPAYELRLAERAGQSSRYRLSFEIRMRAEYRGTAEPDDRTRRLIEALSSGMVLRTAMEYQQTLAEVEGDGTRVFDVRWHDYEFAGEIGGKPVPPPPAHVEATRQLLANTARVRTAPTGRTLEVSYSDPRLSALTRSFETLEGALPTYLPQRPVSVGDRWTSTARIPVGATGAGGLRSLALELTHELAEVREGPDGPIAVIRLRGSYSQLEGMGEPMLGAPMHIEATLTGATEFDISKGRFTDGHYEIDMFALHADRGVEVELIGHADGDLQLLGAR